MSSGFLRCVPALIPAGLGTTTGSTYFGAFAPERFFSALIIAFTPLYIS